MLIYRVYPAVLFASCMCTLLLAIVLMKLATAAVWPLFLIPIPAALFGKYLTSLVVRRFPRIRFLNEAEIDGLGYVHQPLSTMLVTCIIGFGISVAQTL